MFLLRRRRRVKGDTSGALARRLRIVAPLQNFAHAPSPSSEPGSDVVRNDNEPFSLLPYCHHLSTNRVLSSSCPRNHRLQHRRIPLTSCGRRSSPAQILLRLLLLKTSQRQTSFWVLMILQSFTQWRGLETSSIISC